MFKWLLPLWLALLSGASSKGFAQDLFAAHIEIRLGDTSENFYRVMMDFDEQPYLSIENLAQYLLEMNGDCSGGECEFFLPHDLARELPSYSVNLNQKTCHSEQNAKTTIETVEFEGDTFVHWDSLPQCLPITTKWVLDDYKLYIDKNFKSLSELEKDISKLKKSIRDKALEAESRHAQTVIPANSDVGLASRLAVSTDYDSNEQHIELSALADILFSTENSLSQLSIDSKLEDPISYYNIAVSTNQGSGRLELGHILLDGDTFINNQSLKHGLYYTNRVQQPGFGNLQLENSTKPNIEVDVLVNGIYRNSYLSDSFGRFTIDEQNISPGDTVTFRYYLGEGLWSEEEITVAGIDSAFLPKGEWATKFAYGNDETQAGVVSIDYGLTDYGTLGISLFHIEDETYSGVQAQFLPTHWLSTRFGWIAELDRFPTRFDVLLSKSQSLTIDLNKADNFDADELEYHQLDYSLSTRHFSFTSRATIDDNAFELNPTLRRQLSPSLYLSYAANYDYSRTNHRSSTLHKVELTKSSLSDTSWAINTELDEYGDYYRSSARLRKNCSNCWLNPFSLFQQVSTSLQLNHQDDDLTAHASYSADINHNLHLTLDGDQESYRFQLTAEFGAKTNFDSETTHLVGWDEYSYAAVKGTVVDQNGSPIADVKLQLLSQHATTNQNGEFTFERIPARKELTLKIDEGSLDLSLSPEQNPIFLNTREIATTEVVVTLINSFGADGFIKADINDKAFIYFKHLNKLEEYSSVVEADGFYVVEGLIAGLYLITLEIGGKEYVLSKQLDADFWLGGLDFSLEDFERTR
ncbi:hypothetical protein VSVS12_03949 [Vibrio scophthalmi]|uniref:carboxypeptidase-like regulatory domain-containing protein n=1 Tax=Vibrio scophthalmi TaxID=45658 RepID=UPI0008092FB8|nr:carboxypeptidase-like regulatory domain-containing protein [Vibrio scophthalmi]ANS87649.1 hypothetical protein VSVS12_03949 [Vibrio scophthalmi]